MYFRIVINHSLVALYCIVTVAIYIQHPPTLGVWCDSYTFLQVHVWTLQIIILH